MTVYVCHYSMSPTDQTNQLISSVFPKNNILTAIVGTLDSPFKGTNKLKKNKSGKRCQFLLLNDCMIIMRMKNFGINKNSHLSIRSPKETLVPCVRSGDCLRTQQALSGS